MHGKIIIEVGEDGGVRIQTKLHQVDGMDRLFLVHSVGSALNLEPDEYVMIALAAADNVMKPTVIEIDSEGLRQQLKEEENF